MSVINAHRIGGAVGFPGIDGRTWISHGVVVDVIVEATALDKSKGGHLLLVELDDGQRELCRVAQAYGGNGYGMHTPYVVDDWVAVAYVGSDHQGPVPMVIGMAWDGAHAIPSEVVEHPADVHIVVRDRTNLRIHVSGLGNVVITADDLSLIKLGNDDLNVIQTGALNGEAIDPYTGLQHWELNNASRTVLVKKGPL